MIKRISALLLAATTVLATTTKAQAPAAPPAQRHRIAVLDFGDGAVMDAGTAIFGTRTNIGKGISDMLVDKLTNDGVYRVIERNAISKVLDEQHFANSSAVDPSSAAKLGKVLGVDAIITGDITTFGRDDSHKGLAGGGGNYHGIGLGGLGFSKSKAVVAITARLVDATTGEVLASVTSRGESKRSGATFFGGGAGSGGGGAGGGGFGSSNFGATIIGEATQASVQDLAAKLEEGNSKLPTAEAQPIEGMVADVAGSDIIINVGKQAGVQVGTKLTVMHPVRTVKDPATGKVIRTIENNVGELVITSADATSAVGTFHGSAVPKVGDTVRSPR
jgi:curli biogenesis system outer membrane secretion channel CsgG